MSFMAYSVRTQNLLELITCVLLLGIKLHEPLANNAIDLIRHLKLGPVGSGQSLHEHRQDVMTTGQNSSYVKSVVR